VLTDPRAFKGVAGAVLLLLSVRVLVGRHAQRDREHKKTTANGIRPWTLVSLAGVVGLIGGMYGIGGASLLSPVLVALGIAVGEVAGAALVVTFGSSVAGLAAYVAFASGSASTPFWTLAVCLGVGGLGGSYVGARAHRWLPEGILTWLIAVLAACTGVSYLVQAAGR
jgi:uncharacterized membrane protein YfcA